MSYMNIDTSMKIAKVFMSLQDHELLPVNLVGGVVRTMLLFYKSPTFRYYKIVFSGTIKLLL